ncbi:hypothetical protein [Croceicoccus sp. YJ47]|uniref:hypothetical protein n=1 Tax=Croceicoccus sp. YJ47 TaxID=2798724 RepID=UPI0019247801|nr:hypothetical protein [Croceicoccus sp. YJ47]QQN73382.1 hypothetical protein JD971_11125 [Croceicoccus sp. YJ47]
MPVSPIAHRGQSPAAAILAVPLTGRATGVNLASSSGVSGRYPNAVAASLLMAQVLAPRLHFTPKEPGPLDDFDYGPGGYSDAENNVGVRDDTGQVHVVINELFEPKSDEAQRICKDDLNEFITQFVQDKSSLEQGLLNEETVPQELIQRKMGKIVRDRYPDLSAEDHAVVRQHAISALDLTLKAKAVASGMADVGTERSKTALIDSINPCDATCAVFAKAMNETVLQQVQSVITAKNI